MIKLKYDGKLNAMSENGCLSCCSWSGPVTFLLLLQSPCSRYGLSGKATPAKLLSLITSGPHLRFGAMSAVVEYQNQKYACVVEFENGETFPLLTESMVTRANVPGNHQSSLIVQAKRQMAGIIGQNSGK